MLSTMGAGWAMYDASRKRLVICRQLVVLCDALKRDLMYRSTPLKELLLDTIDTYKLHALSFINSENITSNVMVKTSLSAGVNKEISSFLSSLGKSDTDTQLVLISGFRDYISEKEKEYKNSHTKNSKLYLTFGVFAGLLTVLVLV